MTDDDRIDFGIWERELYEALAGQIIRRGTVVCAWCGQAGHAQADCVELVADRWRARNASQKAHPQGDGPW